MGLFASYNGNERNDYDGDSAPLLNENESQAHTNPFASVDTGIAADETTSGSAASSSIKCCSRIPLLGKQFESYSNISLLNLTSAKEKLAKRAFGVHWLVSVALAWNWMVCLVILLDPSVMGSNADGWTQRTLMASLYWIDLVAGYYLWLQPMLTVLQTGSSVRYFWSTFSYSLHCLFLILMLLGFPGMSSTGIFTLLRVSKWVDTHGKPFTLTVAFCGVSTALFAMSFFAALWVGVSVRRMYAGKTAEGLTQVREQASRQVTKGAFDAVASGNRFNMPV